MFKNINKKKTKCSQCLVKAKPAEGREQQQVLKLLHVCKNNVFLFCPSRSLRSIMVG